MPTMESTLRLKTAQAEYDFAVDGGATGTIVLRSPTGDSHGNLIPAGAIVEGGVVDVETACLSGTGTIALQLEAAGDLVAAAGQASWTLGRKSLIPAFTGATTVKTTVARSLTIVIATAAYTAGKFRVTVFYK